MTTQPVVTVERHLNVKKQIPEERVMWSSSLNYVPVHKNTWEILHISYTGEVR